MKNTKSIVTRLFKYHTMTLVTFSVLIYGIFLGGYFYIYKQQVNAHLMDVETLSRNNIEGILEEANQLSIRILSDSVIQSNLTSIRDDMESGITITNARYSRYNSAITSSLRSHALMADHVAGIRIISIEDNTFSYKSTEDITFTYKSDSRMLVEDVREESIYHNNGKEHWYISDDNDRIYLARSILSLTDMQPLAYMVLFYDNHYLCSRLKELNTPYSGHVYILDQDNVIVSAPDASLIGTKLTNEVNRNGSFSSMIVDPSSKDQCYYSEMEIANTEWRMLITVRSADIWHNLFMIMGIIIFIIIMFCIISILITKKYINSAMNPAKELRACMNQFGNGDLNARMSVKNLDEIGQISEGYNQMADKIQTLLEQVYSLEIENKEAEINHLKMQINPHFLYNTLDTISWLGFRHGNEDVSNLAVALARMLRFNISSKGYVTVAQEIECIKDYLEIQEYRFKDRFNMELNVDENVRNLYMPQFLLQPLIENCFNHGLEGLIKQGELQLQIYGDKDSVRFIVRDNGSGISEERLVELRHQFEEDLPGKSIGLINVYRRLHLLYGDSADFTINSKPGEGTLISFRIPVISSVETSPIQIDNKE